MRPRRLTQIASRIIVTQPTLLLHVLLLALIVVAFSIPAASPTLRLHWRQATAEEVHQHQSDQLAEIMELMRQQETQTP